MIGYFQSIPKELDEAALIDGAGHLQMLLKIFIPVELPGIIAATILLSRYPWAAFVYPIAFSSVPISSGSRWDGDQPDQGRRFTNGAC